MPRRLLLLGPLLVLLGCPPDDGSVPPAFPGLEATPAAAPAGTAEPEHARQDRPVETARVCLLLPESGEARDDGAEMRRGMLMARQQIEKEAWRTRRIEWLEHDTKSSEPVAVESYMKCVNEGVPVIIGPVHPAPKTAIIPVAAAHDAVLMIPEVGAAVPVVWGPKLFAIAPPSSDMGGVAARNMVVERGIKDLAILHTPGVFGEGIRDSFKKAAEKDGGKVLDDRALDPKNPDAWGKALTEVVASKAVRGVLVVGSAEIAMEVVGKLDADGMGHTQLWFIDWAMFPPVLDVAKEHEALGRIHWVNRRAARGAFADDYTNRFQTRPQFEAGDGYDAILAVANAVESAKSLWVDDIAAALRETRGLKSAYGLGSLTEARGLTFLDAAGYQVIEPEPDPASGDGGWYFAEPE